MITIAHSGIDVLDLEESLEFYTETLGLQVARRLSPREGATLVFLKGEGDGMIELVHGMRGPEVGTESGQTRFSHIGLVVSDMDALAQTLRDKGISFTLGPIETPAGAKMASIKDPNGVEIEFIQHPEP